MDSTKAYNVIDKSGEMALADNYCESISEMLQEIRKPLASTCFTFIQQRLDQNAQDTNQNIISVNQDMHAICEKMGSGNEVKDEKWYEIKLQEIMKAKEEHVDVQTKNLQMVSEVNAEKAKLQSDLKNLKHQTEVKVKPQYKLLEKEKATFSAYLKLCGHLRLDSQHRGPEVRGTVSREPTTDVTFSLEPAALSPVQLTDRLWQIAAEHRRPADRSAHRPAAGELASQSAEGSKTPEATERNGKSFEPEAKLAAREERDGAKENIPHNRLEA